MLQEFSEAVDPSLTPDDLNELGGKLKNLPKGWTFETKVLTKDLTLDTGRCGGWAAILRDDLHCTYQACGYTKDTQRQLRALVCSQAESFRTPGHEESVGVNHSFRSGLPVSDRRGDGE